MVKTVGNIYVEINGTTFFGNAFQYDLINNNSVPLQYYKT